MDNVKHYGNLFPLDETICKGCIHRLSRIIVPLDAEDFFIEEDLDKMGLDDGESIVVEQHSCLKINQDLNYLVQECNHFSSNPEYGFFKSNPYA